jgi:hypothetical protein
MTSIRISYNIEIRWVILGYSNYGFGENKKLYNLKTNREIKLTLNGYSKGYWLNNKFLTLNKLKNLLIKIPKEDCPF